MNGRLIASAAVLLAGAIHVLPLLGVVGAEQIGVLYGVEMDDSNLAVLMRHRAVLFGLLGSLLIAAAFRPHLMRLAIAGGSISAVSFLVLALSEGGLNDAMNRVLMADVVALVCLGVAVAALRLTPTYGRRSARVHSGDL